MLSPYLEIFVHAFLEKWWFFFFPPYLIFSSATWERHKMSYKMEKLLENSDMGTLLGKRHILIQKGVSNIFFLLSTNFKRETTVLLADGDNVPHFLQVSGVPFLYHFQGLKYCWVAILILFSFFYIYLNMRKHNRGFCFVFFLNTINLVKTKAPLKWDGNTFKYKWVLNLRQHFRQWCL